MGALLLVQAVAIHAQPQAVLSGPASCAQCRIELERVVTFGDSAGPGMLQEQSTIATDRRGRFYAASNYDPTIAVFDAAGRFLQRIGRKGPGPGEFRFRPTMLFGPGDSLYAVDVIERRIAVFSPQYKLVRTATFQIGASDVVRTADGRFLATGATRFANGNTYPVHVMGPDGAHISSFGSPTRQQDRVSLMDAYRRIASPTESHVWTSQVDAYVLRAVEPGRPKAGSARAADPVVSIPRLGRSTGGIGQIPATNSDERNRRG